jgi:hypothetical protein
MERKIWMRKKVMIFFFIIIAVLAFGAVVMALWNAILPQVTNVKSISYPQALGILLLSKILFGGFRGGWGGHYRRGRWMEMQQKMASMTPEEREKFKSEWKNRCGHRWRTDATPASAASE